MVNKTHWQKSWEEENPHPVDDAIKKWDEVFILLAKGKHYFPNFSVAMQRLKEWRNKQSQSNAGAKEETKPMLTEHEDAIDILRKIYSTEPCELDHHGFCQTHGWMSAALCPHQRAKEYLKKYPEKEWRENSLDMHCDGGDDGY